MKTLVIGDIHLMCKIIIPLIENAIKTHEINRIIMVGDYVDQWGMVNNHGIYLQELEFLKNWKSEKENIGIEVVNLIGNHDIPHMTGKPMYYSLQNPLFFDIVGEKLFGLGTQVAYRLDDFIVSHAGYTIGYEPEGWHTILLTKNDIPKLDELHEQAGKSRGGHNAYGGPVWADFNRDLTCYFNPNIPKQIVGHTPQSTITFLNNNQIIGVDTFSLARSLLPISDGSMLLYQQGGMDVIPNSTWKTMENWDSLLEHFGLGDMLE